MKKLKGFYKIKRIDSITSLGSPYKDEEGKVLAPHSVGFGKRISYRVHFKNIIYTIEIPRLFLPNKEKQITEYLYGIVLGGEPSDIPKLWKRLTNSEYWLDDNVKFEDGGPKDITNFLEWKKVNELFESGECV